MEMVLLGEECLSDVITFLTILSGKDPGLSTECCKRAVLGQIP